MKRFVSDDTKMVAFNFFHNQSQLFAIVCDCYDLRSSKHIFVDRIRELITEQKYKDACQSACDLQLYEGFSIHDFLVPLILQDKMSVAEKYLGKVKEHQVRQLFPFFSMKNKVQYLHFFFSFSSENS